MLNRERDKESVMNKGPSRQGAPSPRYAIIALSGFLGALPALVARAGDLDTGFSYRGFLEKPAGTPVTDVCDFHFGLWDAEIEGAQNGAPAVTVRGVVVTEGVFTVELDFGTDAFSGDAPWLEIGVECTDDAGLVMLPRQQLKSSRYALRPAEDERRPGALSLTPDGDIFDPEGDGDRALIALLYRTGLRINEALSLYPKDLDLKDGSVRVLNGKGGRSRTVGLDPGAAAVIERWLDVRTSLGLNGRQPVFCTLRGNPMSDAYIRRLLKRLARRCGIDKRVHAHGLRHTHAAQLRAEGVDIGIISKQLGHASISTTARYLDHLAPTAVVEAIRSRIWNGA